LVVIRAVARTNYRLAKNLRANAAGWRAEGAGETAETGKAEAGKAQAGKAEAGKAEAGKAEAGKAEAGAAKAGELPQLRPGWRMRRD
jgi:hypothetical protein